MRIITRSARFCCIALVCGLSFATAAPEAPEGISITDWGSIREAYEAGRHSFVAGESGWQARNPGQRWATEFDGRGFLAIPDEGEWTWGLELISYGVGAEQVTVDGSRSVAADGQRLNYQWDDRLEEWWINDERGLEHGYVISERPEPGKRAEATDPLRFHLATRGGLNPKVSVDALGVVFEDGDGLAILNYTGLKAWDADGQFLASRFEPGEAGRVVLVVDDQEARYPVTIDPIAQQAFLKAGNAGEGDTFGVSVAVSGDTIVVGAPFEDSNTTGVINGPGGSSDNSAGNAGAVYVFVRNGATWSQQAYLKAGNSDAGDNFGEAVAISGDAIVVGAPFESSGVQGVINGPDGSTDNTLPNTGAAYVFVRNGTTWSQQAYLKAGNSNGEDFFGEAVAISGETIVVGAEGERSIVAGVINGPGGSANNGAFSVGAAYVFGRDGLFWSQQAYLKAGNAEGGDGFGASVGISGETIVVGAHFEDSNATGVLNSSGGSADNSAPFSGAAYVFVRSGTAWSQQAYLKAGNTDAEDIFGASVAISGDTVAVGAVGEESNATGVNNSPGGSPDNSAPESGAAYVFVRSGATWSQQAYLKAANTGLEDEFGESIALSGDKLVVGAPFEDSNATGVTVGNSGSSDDSLDSSGAAYLFIRSGTTWSQEAFLKAAVPGSSDVFGRSAAISDGTIAVGAELERSNVTGVINGGGASADDSAGSSGATYVFFSSSNDAPVLTISKPRRFPATGIGKRSRPQVITVSNSGGSSASGLRVKLSGPGRRDFILKPASSASLAPGAGQKIQIVFSPRKLGGRRALLTVRSDAPSAAAQLVGRGK